MVPSHEAGTGRGAAEGTSKLLREKRVLCGPEGVARDRALEDRCLRVQSSEGAAEQEQDGDGGGGGERIARQGGKQGLQPW